MTDSATLAQAARALRRENTPGMHDIADAMQAVADGRADSLDAALGLRRRPGERRQSTLARLRRRDHAICVGAQRYSGKPKQRGRALHRDLVKYQQATWKRDRRTCEPAPTKQHLYDVLTECIDSDFPGPERLAQIIAAGKRNTGFSFSEALRD